MVQPVTRSTRNIHLPVKIRDYTGFPDHLVHVNTILLTTDEVSLSMPKIEEPRVFKQAVNIPEWCEAMGVELADLEANDTW